MKNSFIILFVITIISAASIVSACSQKQIWYPLKIVNIDVNYDIIGENGNNNVYRILVSGKFHPGTHALDLSCGYEDCCSIIDKIAKYRVSYCINQPCTCISTLDLPSKCLDIPLASFCQPEDSISCSGPYFKQFDDFSGNVADPGLAGGCPTNNQLRCKTFDIPILEFQSSFIFELSKDANYPYNLDVSVCFTEGIKNRGDCAKKTVTIVYRCPEPCCPPECKPPCKQSDDCGGDNDDDDPNCYGKLRISSNGWITFRILKNGIQVVPWTNLSNINTNPALVANGPLMYDLKCGIYDIEYDKEDQLEEGNEICWTPDKRFTIRRNKITDVLANKREFHYHIKFRDGHYEPHAPWDCPYNQQSCNR